ncbi:unnamed protein product, partial [Meganyctiphanes norvegica]
CSTKTDSQNNHITGGYFKHCTSAVPNSVATHSSYSAGTLHWSCPFKNNNKYGYLLCSERTCAISIVSPGNRDTSVGCIDGFQGNMRNPWKKNNAIGKTKQSKFHSELGIAQSLCQPHLTGAENIFQCKSNQFHYVSQMSLWDTYFGFKSVCVYRRPGSNAGPLWPISSTRLAPQALSAPSCQFPFIYIGVTHTTYTAVNDPEGKLWCSTKTDSKNNHITGGNFFKHCTSANLVPSVVHGEWTPWSPWTSCSANCQRQRIRSCSDPTPSIGGRTCPGKSTSSEKCTNGPCATRLVVHGEWSSWSPWKFCSAQCQRQRNRSCTNPRPSTNGGRTCHGESTSSEKCTTGQCAK